MPCALHTLTAFRTACSPHTPALNLATRLEAAGDDAVAVPVDGDMAPLLARMREERLMDDLEEGMTYRRPAAGGWGDFVWGFLLGTFDVLPGGGCCCRSVPSGCQRADALVGGLLRW